MENINQADFDDAKYPIVLADKTPSFLNVAAEDIRERITDDIMSGEEFGDDTETIPDLLKAEIDWNGFAAKINEVLKKSPYYYLTDIKLIP